MFQEAVKCFAKAEVNSIHSLSLIHKVSHLITGDQVGQTRPALHEPILAGQSPLVVLHLLCEHTQDEPLHNLPWYQDQSDRSGVPWILLLALLVYKHQICKPAVIGDLPCKPGLLVNDTSWYLVSVSFVSSLSSIRVVRGDVTSPVSKLPILPLKHPRKATS